MTDKMSSYGAPRGFQPREPKGQIVPKDGDGHTTKKLEKGKIAPLRKPVRKNPRASKINREDR